MRTARGVSFTVLCALLLCCAANAFTVKKMLDALNKARTNPRYYAGFIKSEYKDKTVNGIHSAWRLRFNEATPAVFDEAIRFLNAQAPMEEYKIDLGMTYATWKHCKYLGDELKHLDHSGRDGSGPSDRIEVYASGMIYASGEVLISNRIAGKTEEHMIAEWITDDGVSSRGHRNNIFSSKFKIAGIGIYTDASGMVWVGIAFASNYNCGKCSSINSSMQQQCGWSQYLTGAGSAGTQAQQPVQETQPIESSEKDQEGDGFLEAPERSRMAEVQDEQSGYVWVISDMSNEEDGY